MTAQADEWPLVGSASDFGEISRVADGTCRRRNTDSVRTIPSSEADPATGELVSIVANRRLVPEHRYLLLIVCLLMQCLRSERCAAEDVAATQPATSFTKAQIHQSIHRGVEFLQHSQQPDGFWGTGTETHGNEVYSQVPGSMDSFRIGATALAVMALREAGETTSHARGLEWLLKAPDARRDTGDLIYNTWAHIYLLQAMAEEMPHNADPRLHEVANRQVDRLTRYATYMGGWNYYDFHAETQAPSLGPTSFGTAAGLVALYEAKQAGIEIPEKLSGQAFRRLQEMRQPGGTYLYGSDYKYIPRLPANRPKGAVGRTQPANYALKLWGWDKLGKPEIRQGLDLLFEYHGFLDMGRKRPIPHQSWYQTSGYYYYFDHYYASRLFEMLDDSDVKQYAPKLVAAVLPHQDPDGAWWDYAMWDFHKPYGTAFAIMTLLRCANYAN